MAPESESLKARKEIVAKALALIEKGVSDEEVAEKLGKHPETVARWRRAAARGSLQIRAQGRPKIQIEPTKTLTISLTPESHARLEKLAARRKKTPREFVETLIETAK